MAIKKKNATLPGIKTTAELVKKSSYLIATADDTLVEASPSLPLTSKPEEDGLARHSLALFDYHVRTPIHLDAPRPTAPGGIR